MALLFGRKKKLILNQPDPEYEVIYLGNVLTSMAKGEADKPLALIWRTYCAKVRPNLRMKLVVCRTGLRASIDQLGLTEYWAHRITWCTAPERYPRVFCWIYKHEGKKMKPELRCHAALCKRTDHPERIVVQLQSRIAQALCDYKREKLARQNWRLSSCSTAAVAAGCQPPVPRRRLMLSTGGQNFRPPVTRSKSAPKLQIINEEEDEEASCSSSPSLQVEPTPRPLLHRVSTQDCYSSLKNSGQFILYYAQLSIDSQFEETEDVDDFDSSVVDDVRSTNRNVTTLPQSSASATCVRSPFTAAYLYDKSPVSGDWSDASTLTPPLGSNRPTPFSLVRSDSSPLVPTFRNGPVVNGAVVALQRENSAPANGDQSERGGNLSLPVVDWTRREEDAVSDESGYHEEDKLQTFVYGGSASDEGEIVVSL